MTKSEAIELQSKCEEHLSVAIGETCHLSFTLNGRLCMSFSDGYINFDRALENAEYIKYQGDYECLQDIINWALVCFDTYIEKELFEKLIWSYEHYRELEE